MKVERGELSQGWGKGSKLGKGERKLSSVRLTWVFTEHRGANTVR